MKRLFVSAAITLLMLRGAAVAAAELPTYERMGFPISAHQISVMGSANIEEASPAPTLTLGGMPASPHHIAVLSPRPRITDEALTMGFGKAAAAMPR
ncbi:MAG: hypothetical protein HY852_26325 [Bradyrhizobium sp.]|uniref:hypothetical protein n=1 Tax=Bradyrhizobium sp. TaxID=376 RepID=UPI0025B8F5AD|nr:hypothetical protein [Bradyrhizobium sp.]MBI5265325.1 hypothetical protein [Bradyrhizobium sp.]